MTAIQNKFVSMLLMGICFYVVDGNHSRLNGVYFNGESSYELQKELSDLIYSSGQTRFPYTQFPVEAVKEGATVIVCGFVP